MWKEKESRHAVYFFFWNVKIPNPSYAIFLWFTPLYYYAANIHHQHELKRFVTWEKMMIKHEQAARPCDLRGAEAEPKK